MPQNSPNRQALNANLAKVQAQYPNVPFLQQMGNLPRVAPGQGPKGKKPTVAQLNQGLYGAPASQVQTIGPGGKVVSQYPIAAPGARANAQAGAAGKNVAQGARAIKIANAVQDVANHSLRPIRGARDNTLNTLRAAPSPGGIMLPLGILLLLMLVLLPVGGHTRLMWLWLAFTGNAVIGAPPAPPPLLPSAVTTAVNLIQGYANAAQATQTKTQQQNANTGQTQQHTNKQPGTTTGGKSPTGGGPTYNPTDAVPAMNPNQIQQRSYIHAIGGRSGYE